MCPRLDSKKKVLLFYDKRDNIFPKQLSKNYTACTMTLYCSPNSPGLLPTGYYFKHLEHFLAEKRFTNEIAMKNAIEQLPRPGILDFYVTGINVLVSQWKRCIASNGVYLDYKKSISAELLFEVHLAHPTFHLQQPNIFKSPTT